MKRFFSLFLFAPFLLANKAPEHYRFENATITRTDVQVKVVSVYNTMLLQQKASDFGMELASTVQAFSVWSPNTNRCTIFIVEPKKSQTPNTAVVGHELLHCFYGDWHRNQE